MIGSKQEASLDYLLVRSIIEASMSYVLVVNETYQTFLNDVENIQTRSEYNYRTTPKIFRKWTDIIIDISDRLFRRMFRCNKESFIELSKKINAVVGNPIFKPEQWIADKKI